MADSIRKITRILFGEGFQDSKRTQGYRANVVEDSNDEGETLEISLTDNPVTPLEFKVQDDESARYAFSDVLGPQFKSSLQTLRTQENSYKSGILAEIEAADKARSDDHIAVTQHFINFLKTGQLNGICFAVDENISGIMRQAAGVLRGHYADAQDGKVELAGVNPP